MKKRIANSIITTLKSMDGRRINGARKVVAGYVRSARNILPDSFSCIGFQSFRCSFQQKRESCSLKRYCTTSVQSNVHTVSQLWMVYHINPKMNKSQWSLTWLVCRLPLLCGALVMPRSGAESFGWPEFH